MTASNKSLKKPCSGVSIYPRTCKRRRSLASCVFVFGGVLGGISVRVTVFLFVGVSIGFVFIVAAIRFTFLWLQLKINLRRAIARLSPIASSASSVLAASRRCAPSSARFAGDIVGEGLRPCVVGYELRPHLELRVFALGFRQMLCQIR